MKYRSIKNYGFYELQKSKFLTEKEEIGCFLGFLMQKFIQISLFLEYLFAREDFATNISFFKKPLSLRDTNSRAFRKLFFVDFVSNNLRKSLMLEIKCTFNQNFSENRLI